MKDIATQMDVEMLRRQIDEIDFPASIESTPFGFKKTEIEVPAPFSTFAIFGKKVRVYAGFVIVFGRGSARYPSGTDPYADTTVTTTGWVILRMHRTAYTADIVIRATFPTFKDSDYWEFPLCKVTLGTNSVTIDLTEPRWTGNIPLAASL